MKIVFPVIKRYGSKSGNCPVCGTRRRRSRVFEATVNPFNRDKKGNVKTADQVADDVLAKLNAWVPDFTCQTHQEN